ncbi:MAG: mycothiol transferase [Candidatus Dormibacteria bacterium]
MISDDDYLYFIDEQLDAMLAMVEELGDHLANTSLDAAGSNSPYAILTHCLGVIEFWGGHVVAGRPSERDRAAEFTASGPVAPLVARTRRARQQLAKDVRGAVAVDPPPNTSGPETADLPIGRTQGGALIHLHEDLARHRGQMDITRDLLLMRHPRQ